MEFDPFTYDKWYDENRDIFLQEASIIREAGIECPSAEIGAGTGKFSEDLEIDIAIDLSRGMIEFAKTRAKATLVGSACSLPFRDKSFGTSVFAFSMSFIKCKVLALNEAKRISKFTVVLDFVPDDGYLKDLKAEYGDMEPPYLDKLDVPGSSVQINRTVELNFKGTKVTLALIKFKWI